MAGRTPNILKDIQSILQTAATVYERRLKYQVPVKTGQLRSSIKVKAKINPDWDSVNFEIGYKRYGRFTDLGTGVYFKGEPETAKWTSRKGPKGKGGIRPRYWTYLDQSETQKIMNIINPVVAEKIKEYWNTIQSS